MDNLHEDCKAYEIGVNDYGVRDTCPFTYEDLRYEWRCGWFRGLAALAGHKTMKENISVWN